MEMEHIRKMLLQKTDIGLGQTNDAAGNATLVGICQKFTDDLDFISRANRKRVDTSALVMGKQSHTAVEKGHALPAPHGEVRQRVFAAPFFLMKHIFPVDLGLFRGHGMEIDQKIHTRFSKFDISIPPEFPDYKILVYRYNDDLFIKLPSASGAEGRSFRFHREDGWLRRAGVCRSQSRWVYRQCQTGGCSQTGLRIGEDPAFLFPWLP